MTVAYTIDPAGGLISQRRNGATYYHHYDALGSTRLVTDSSQATAASYVYDAFGNLLSQTGSLTNPYEYVGKPGYFTDPGASALLFLRARYCSPEEGRFLASDPLSRDRREYSYASNGPIRWVDPSGLGRDRLDPVIVWFQCKWLYIYYEQGLDLPYDVDLETAVAMFADRAAMSPRWEPIRKGQRWFYANKGGLGLKTGVRVQDESGNVIGDTGSRVFYAPAPVKRSQSGYGEPVLDIPQDVLNAKDCIQTVQIVQSTSAMAGLSLLVRGLMGVQEGDDRIVLYWERLNELHAKAVSSSPPLGASSTRVRTAPCSCTSSPTFSM